jgi:hypothetical protein
MSGDILDYAIVAFWVGALQALILWCIGNMY